jgi:hypothetical protein
MQSNILRNEMAVIKHLNLQPFITLLLPFEPKMTPKHILEGRIKCTLEKVKNELYEHYSFVIAKEVFERMLSIINNLDYNTHKKSVAVFVSSDDEKIIYLDVNVEDKFFITNSFQIRQLVIHQKDNKEYLLVVINKSFVAIYRGIGRIISKILLRIPDYKRQEQQSGKNCNNVNCQNEEELFQNFLQSADKSLSFLHKAFSLPVFVFGSEVILEKFKNITLNKDVIVGYMDNELDNNSEDDIERTIDPYISNWLQVKDRYYKQQVESASKSGSLVAGIEGVWNSAKRKNIKLLVVEEGYEYQAYLGKGLIVCAEEVTSNPYIKDVVEDTIERVFANGGNVAFVSNGTLSNYMHIAAIRNF